MSVLQDIHVRVGGRGGGGRGGGGEGYMFLSLPATSVVKSRPMSTFTVNPPNL